MANELAAAIQNSAARLGISPLDLGTVISYETAGTFDPWKAGPATQYGQHRGLIQWGEPQRQRYGVTQGMPIAGQLQAVEKYLTDAGVRPGMGLLDVYSAVNAGRVGRYNASDANNGGAPGTVADKVNNQMGAHMRKAAALLGGSFTPPPASAQGVAAPTSIASLYSGEAAIAPSAAPAADHFGALASLFTQQQLRRNEQRAAEQEAEQTKRAALFGGGVASLYG